MVDRIGTLIILGASGDLTKRLLLPGLGEVLERSPHHQFRLLGVGINAMTDDDWRDRISGAFAEAGASSSHAQSVARNSRYLQADVTKAADLSTVLAEVEGVPALYFALPPEIAIAACGALEQVGLPSGTILALEKPFGTDLRSAQALNRQLLKLVPDAQIHRIDHFLSKSTVLNLLGVRFANRVFGQVWSTENIARIDVIFDEQLALEGRAGYYDKAGALVDMIQSHLLLVLALVAMDPPSSLDKEDLRTSMTQVLRATRVWRGDPKRFSRRARYTGGTIDGHKLPAYIKELGVDPELETETLAEITLAVQNWRWAGVPIHLRSGKALADKRQVIVITFRDVPHRPHGFTGVMPPTQLRINLTPDSIEFDLNINGEGDPLAIDRVTLATDFAGGTLSPYGEVLTGVLTDDATLSIGADTVEECWRIVAPVLSAWGAGTVPIESYHAGTAGPTTWH